MRLNSRPFPLSLTLLGYVVNSIRRGLLQGLSEMHYSMEFCSALSPAHYIYIQHYNNSRLNHSPQIFFCSSFIPRIIDGFPGWTTTQIHRSSANIPSHYNHRSRFLWISLFGLEGSPLVFLQTPFRYSRNQGIGEDASFRAEIGWDGHNLRREVSSDFVCFIPEGCGILIPNPIALFSYPWWCI